MTDHSSSLLSLLLVATPDVLPAGAAPLTASATTIEQRPYRDAQGRSWLFSGNRSFQLEEQDCG